MDLTQVVTKCGLHTYSSLFPNDVSKAQILAEVWGFQNAVSTHTLETHIYRLRQKISRLTDKRLVLTTERGYCLADQTG